MTRAIRNLARSDRGNVAPTVALSLFALIAVGGIAFDYARLATMDSELQDAADQAALAAASQLTGDTGACARAANAAANMISNSTLMANDGVGGAVAIANEPACDATGKIRFYSAYSINATTGAVTKTAATGDADAKYVEVEVNPRTANYALTPVVQAISSGPSAAIALASLGEAFCKVPPVMICNPQETPTSTTFDASAMDGVGLRLVSVGSGTGGWAPGNFGYLDMAGLSNGAPGLREGLGWGVPPTNCIAETGLDTKPGATVTVTDAINTRFDMYTNVSCPAGGTCPASINSIKDVRRPANATGGNSCAMHPTQGWQLPAGYYGSGSIPSSATVPLDPSITPTAMGLPRDMCHSVDMSTPGACVKTQPNGSLDWDPIGNGNWDRNAYFRTNYGWDQGTWQTLTGLGPTPRRFDVYEWEITHRGESIGGRTILGPSPAGATGNTLVAHGAPVCSPAQGYGAGQVPGGTTPDRRKITVAVVNCLEQSVNGNSENVQTIGWLEAFLTEPSLDRDRTNAGDVYVEVIGATTTGVQIVSKKVPYLIE